MKLHPHIEHLHYQVIKTEDNKYIAKGWQETGSFGYDNRAQHFASDKYDSPMEAVRSLFNLVALEWL